MIIETNKITFEEYQKLAQRTEIAKTARDKLINGALGLCGEIAEYAREMRFIEKRIEEAGDVMWYVAEIAAGMGATIADAANIDDAGEWNGGMFHDAGDIADAIKKHVFQGHDLDKQAILCGLNRIMYMIATRVPDFGYSMDDVLRGNVEKLLKRYPHGFDAERSIHR